MRQQAYLMELTLFMRSPRNLLIAAMLACLLGAGLLFRSATAIRLETQHLTASTAASAGAHNPELHTQQPKMSDRLQAFSKILVSREECSNILLKMWTQAEADGVVAAHADYRVERDVEGGFSKMQISMPVTGSYQALKQYAFGLLAKYPGLALNKLEIKAETKTDDTVEGEISFTLLVKES